jgi:hypothetical protein
VCTGLISGFAFLSISLQAQNRSRSEDGFSDRN